MCANNSVSFTYTIQGDDPFECPDSLFRKNVTFIITLFLLTYFYNFYRYNF